MQVLYYTNEKSLCINYRSELFNGGIAGTAARYRGIALGAAARRALGIVVRPSGFVDNRAFDLPVELGIVGARRWCLAWKITKIYLQFFFCLPHQYMI